MKIVISGLGAMGASLALALRNEIPDIAIAGHDFPEVNNLPCAKNLSMKLLPGLWGVRIVKLYF